MKRIVALVLLIAMAFSIISLGSSAIRPSGEPVTDETQHVTESTADTAGDAN